MHPLTASLKERFTSTYASKAMKLVSMTKKMLHSKRSISLRMNLNIVGMCIYIMLKNLNTKRSVSLHSELFK